MRKITQFSVNYPVTVLMMVLAILLTGYISLTKLGVDLFPELNNPRLYIEMEAGNRPPDEIENMYVRNIESQAIRQSDVVNVTSVTSVGKATITVEYAWGKDMDEAFLELQKAMSSYSQGSDIDAIDISQYDPNSSPVMVVALENENLLNLDEVRKVAENYIRNELIRLEGVADVQLAGEEVAEVLIETNPYLLEAYGITASDLSQKIESYNTNVSGGSIEENGLNYSVKGVSMISTPADLARIIIGTREATASETSSQSTSTSSGSSTVPVYLSDVAEIKVQNKTPETMVYLNNKQCIGLSIYKEPRYNTVKVVENLNEALITISKALPGYNFTVVKNQGTFINDAINEVKQSALFGILLAVAVLFLFLRKLNTTLVISIAIPISIIATFVLMYFKGLTLNVMTLGGLALGAGMLVDNAIIVMENISRHLERGKNVFKAAIDGAAEVGGAITASTLTTIVVFLPIVYMQGASGELFKDMSWTVAFSLLSSLVVAMLVIPVLITSIMGKKISKPVKTIKMNWYSGFLAKALNYKWLVIFISALMIGGTVMLVPIIGSEFMPQSSSNNITIELKMPEGTLLQRTNKALENVRNMVLNTMPDDIESIYTQVGEVSSSASGSALKSENMALMYLALTSQGAERFSQIEQNFSDIMDNNPDIQFSFVQEEGSLQSSMGNDEPPLVIEIIGDELEEINDLTEKIKEITMQQAGLYNVESSVENGAPEIDIIIDRVQAGYFGLTIETVVSQLQSRLEGVEAGQYETEGEMRDITIRQPKVNINDLENFEITSGDVSYRLSDVAIITEEQLPREIHRSNQNRVGKVSAYVDDNVTFDHVVKALGEKLDIVPLPVGYRIEMAGQELQRKESMKGLTFALILSVILVYMVMASQFESLVHPFTILLTIPLAMVGALVTFYILGRPLNVMAYIGMIMLAGIAVNNSIILVDKINQLRRSGMAKRDAIIEGGLQRIRPIVMTSLTTILAMVPLTFGFGESADLRSPMAWAVVGGLVTSTLLSLVVIPCVYDVLSGKGKMLRTEDED
ncbi:MAG: efflux RND transporter permease subunit [Prolixibacteraceae bacterium]|nr:efflux RND transporter permease subunit [Prolixibacteraceae bacterium]MBN2649900.1 efflux RND transporter permease subunit [Prolixibacteraceae bacterium]